MSLLSTSANLTGLAAASDLCYGGLGAAGDPQAGRASPTTPARNRAAGYTGGSPGTMPLPGHRGRWDWDRTSPHRCGWASGLVRRTRVRHSPGWPRHPSITKEFECSFVISSFWSSNFDWVGKGYFSCHGQAFCWFGLLGITITPPVPARLWVHSETPATGEEFIQI